MKKIISKLYAHTNSLTILFVMISLTVSVGFWTYVWAADTSEFTQTINAGTLSVDIVDDAYASVTSPSVAMGAKTFSFACQTSTGILGTTSQQIYVKNPDAADAGWAVTIGAATAPTDLWDSAGTPFDFNDAGGCADQASNGDSDSYGGQMTIDPSGGTLAKGSCLSCTTTNISLGSNASFVETTSNSITLLDAASGSNDVGDWTLQDIDVSQWIPKEQLAATDYAISLMMTITPK